MNNKKSVSFGIDCICAYICQTSLFFFFAIASTVLGTSLYRPKRGIKTHEAGKIVSSLASVGSDVITSINQPVDSNQCKYSITHRGEFPWRPKQIVIEWETEDGDINTSTENLVFWGSNTETGQKRISSAAHLKIIRFISALHV